MQPACIGHEVERYKAWISEGTDGLVDGKSPAKSAIFVKNTDANFTGSHIFLSNSIKAATVTSVCLSGEGLLLGRRLCVDLMCCLGNSRTHF